MIATPQNSLAMIVDVQERLLPHIYENQKLQKNIDILIQGLKILEVPFLLNEQYPKGLGKTVQSISSKLPENTPFEKQTFSCCANPATKEQLLKIKKNIVIVFGIETHVCVMQTCLDLLTHNFSPMVVTNCCGSRSLNDHEIATRRMVQAGIVPTTYESILFELCKGSENVAFKQISQLVK